MAMSNQPKGINAFTIGNINLFGRCCTIERCSIKRYQFIRSFIPIQRINDKVKLTFNEYPEEGELRNLQKKKNVQNISFNYDRTESDLSAIDENALSKYKMIDSITNVFDTLQTNRLDNQIWKWFVIFALLFW
jgi:hypothetical protein